MKIATRMFEQFRWLSRSMIGFRLALAGLAVLTTAATPAGESAIRWDAKNAYLKCGGAIDGTIAWPSEPKAACVAMLMCANESPLSAERYQRLVEQIRRVPGCGEP
ncbi:MAG: hypothetical protein ACI4XG_26990 [Bradyrhizobium sp.]